MSVVSATDARVSGRFLLAVAGVLALGPVIIGAYVPALPAIRAEFGSSVGAVQLTVSLSMLVSVIGAAAAGAWSDRIGRRPVVLASVAVFLAGMAACVAAPDIWVLVVGRVLAGASTTCALVVGRAAVADAFDRAAAPMAMATVHVAPLAAFALAPVLGGELTDHLGWRSTFWALGGLGLMVGALAWAYLPETRGRCAPRPRAVGRSPRRLGTGLADPALPGFVGCALVGALHFGASFGFLTAGSHFVIDRRGASSATYGLGFLAVNLAVLVGTLGARPLLPRLGAASTVLLGALVAALGGTAIAVPMATGEPSVLTFFAGGCAVAVGVGLAIPGAAAGVVSAFPAQSGATSGIASLLQMLVAAAAAQLVRVSASERQGWYWVLLAALLWLAVASATVPWARRARGARTGA